MDVGLVTCQRLPEPDPDEEPLLAALRSAGLQADLLAWDDPDGDPAGFDICVLRSCWNYYTDADGFLAWLDNAARVSRLYNPLRVVRWNLHKRYLDDLVRADIEIIPTVWLDRGTSKNLKDMMAEKGWESVVIKPAVSAASFRTERFDAQRLIEGQEFLDALSNERDTMVQQYIPTSERSDERALVWIDGELTHAVRKSPRFAGGVERVSEALPVSDKEATVAARALGLFDDPLLYARVDVMTDPGGRLLVSELELMEPSLFLVQCPDALQRFVRAIARECGGVA